MSWGRVMSCRGWGRTRLALPDAQQAGARASTGLSQGVELDAGGGGSEWSLWGTQTPLPLPGHPHCSCRAAPC